MRFSNRAMCNCNVDMFKDIHKIVLSPGLYLIPALKSALKH